jgi:hypothetical protein
LFNGPEESVLYHLVAENIESFLARQQKRRRMVPRFAERELRAFLDCGILARRFIWGGGSGFNFSRWFI